VVGLRVTLTDGRTHVKDSSEMAFRTAGRAGLTAALAASGMALLEPVAALTVTVPTAAVGAVLGDLASRRAQVTGSTPGRNEVVVTAVAPLAELFDYATRLRTLSQGRAAFTTTPAGYRQR
jgi:elongation factor G